MGLTKKDWRDRENWRQKMSGHIYKGAEHARKFYNFTHVHTETHIYYSCLRKILYFHFNEICSTNSILKMHWSNVRAFLVL